MSEEIFNLYEFIKDNGIETHCYTYNEDKKEIIVLIPPWNAQEFLILLGE